LAFVGYRASLNAICYGRFSVNRLRSRDDGPDALRRSNDSDQTTAMKPAMHSIHLHAALDRILLNLSFQRFAKVAMIMLTRPVDGGRGLDTLYQR